ncbi:hypothetical protein BH11VER1_BH11VER1_34700 [soil metagenome]
MELSHSYLSSGSGGWRVRGGIAHGAPVPTTAESNCYSRWLAVLVLYSLAAFWVSSAIMKIIHLDDFREVLAGHFWIPLGAVSLVAQVVCSWEFLVGICLILPQRRRAAHLVAIILLGLFTIALMISVWNGQSAHCGCGLWDLSPRWAMVRNLALIGLHAWLLVFDLRASRLVMTPP